MQNNSQKLVSVFLYLILAISVVFLGIFFYKTSGIVLPEDAGFQEEINEYGTILDLVIGWAYVLIGLAAAAAIIPAVIQVVSQPKNAVKSLVSIAGVGVLVLIAYSLSDGTPFTAAELPGYEGSDNVSGTLKFADTMLFTMYFLLGGAIVSIIYGEVAKVFK